MKHCKMKDSRPIRARKVGAHEDVFFRDEGDDRADCRLMLLPLLILQGLTFLSLLL